MELKQGRERRKDAANNGLNCTVMELKLIFSVFYQNFRLGLNCTVMELKRAFMQVAKVEDRVLIVPLWN